VLYQGEDSAGNTEDYAETYTTITNATSGAEAADYLIRTKVAGAMTTHATFGAAGVTIATAFTSIGIDDNATAERLDIADTVMLVGSATAASDYIVTRPGAAAAGSLTLNGNSGGTTGGGVRIYGQSHATNPNTVTLLAATAEIARTDATGFMVGTTGIISTAATTVGFSVEPTGRMAQVVANNSCIGQRRTGGNGGVIQTYVDGVGNACGNITTSLNATAFNTSSDGRLKTNLRSIKSGEIIDGLEAWKFDWINADKAGYGVIAQEAEKVFPHAVSINDDGLYSVDNSKFVPVLLVEAKSLRGRVAALETLVFQLNH